MKLSVIHQVKPRVSIDVRFVQYLRAEASTEMLVAAEPFERRFGIHFESLAHFSKEALNELHHSAELDAELLATVTIASGNDPSIGQDILTLSEIVNCASLTDKSRRLYFDTLLRIYQKLPSRPEGSCSDPGTLCVGIEREGRILAETLGCLPEGHSFKPHTKRVPFEEGLLVGMTGIPDVLPEYARCLIIDGAIASGSTLIALIEKLRAATACFHIYSAHSTYEGLRAITRYGSSEGLDIHLTVGHATTGINDHFYATFPEDSSKVVVGDLGDMISSLVTPK